MIEYEKDIEDYICNHQDTFIKKLKEVLHIKEEIKFIGRQVKIGNCNICDLLYYSEDTIDDEMCGKTKVKKYIIIELKNRKLAPRDLAQISRYKTILYDKLYQLDEYGPFDDIYGVLVGFDLEDDMQEINILLNQYQDINIEFINIENMLKFNSVNYHHNIDYIKELNLDERITEILK